MSVQIFPTSNFDQSAITPVFLGTVVSWVLTETLGWVFAGLVVSGYLATLLVLEPRSAAIDIGEAVLTYGIARLLGEHLSRTGLTSRVFARERFLLVVLVSILVRVGVEGVVLPEVVPRATWAYSIGLVVVPRAANSCWKSGASSKPVRIEIDGGRPRRRTLGSVQRVIPNRSVMLDAMIKTYMMLGDDLVAGRHRLEFVTDSNTVVWV